MTCTVWKLQSLMKEKLHIRIPLEKIEQLNRARWSNFLLPVPVKKSTLYMEAFLKHVVKISVSCNTAKRSARVLLNVSQYQIF